MSNQPATAGGASQQNFTHIAQVALQSIDRVLNHWLPGGKTEGHEYLARNPKRADKKPGSFKINLDTGKWADFAQEGVKGSDLISLVAYLDGGNQGKAAAELAQLLGIEPAEPPTATSQRKKSERWQPIIPIPNDAPPPPAAHPKQGRPAAVWSYHDAAGCALCHVYRFNSVDKNGRLNKDFRPLTYCEGQVSGRQKWSWQALPEPRPLYNLHRITQHPDATIVVCEGEKAADAAAQILTLPEYVTTTALNGAQSPSKTDWTPLATRTVWLWPDADEPGREFATMVCRLIQAVQSSLPPEGRGSLYEIPPNAFMTLPDGTKRDALPDKWDAADAVAEGFTSENTLDPIKSLVTLVTVVTAYSHGAYSGNQTENGLVTLVTTTFYRVYEGGTEFGRPGVYYHGVREVKGEKIDVNLWVCGLLHIKAVTCDRDGHNFGRMLRFRDTLGRWHEWAMPMEMLRGSCEELRGQLLSLGLEIDPYNRNRLPAYLQSNAPEKTMEAALFVGWHDRNTFVLPERVIGSEDRVFFQSEHVGTKNYVQRGNLETWQATISRYCIGNPLLILAVSAAFSGALLARCHQDGGGFHIYGDSSMGKSTGLKVACSVWGSEHYRRSWRATANGLEAALALFNDGFLALDEIKEANPREIGQVIYAIGNGVGKQRMSSYCQARNVYRWRVMVLSNGEKPIEARLSEVGQQMHAGQMVRLLEIPVFGAFGAFDHIHEFETANRFADAIQERASECYGIAGITFLEKLISNDEDVAARVDQLLPAFKTDATNGQEQRAARRFALVAVAGELATDYGITGWPEGTAIQATVKCFKAWRNERGAGTHEERQILQSITDFIDRYGDSRFTNVFDTDTRPNDRAGYWRDEGGHREYLFTSAGLREAAKGYAIKKIVAVLTNHGWLRRTDQGRPTIQQKIANFNKRLYAITCQEGMSHEH